MGDWCVVRVSVSGAQVWVPVCHVLSVVCISILQHPF